MIPAMLAFIKEIAVARDDGAAIVGPDAVQIDADIHRHLLVQALAQQRMLHAGAQQDVRVEQGTRAEHEQIGSGALAPAFPLVVHGADHAGSALQCRDFGVQKQGDARIIVNLGHPVLDGELRIDGAQLADAAGTQAARRAVGTLARAVAG